MGEILILISSIFKRWRQKERKKEIIADDDKTVSWETEWDFQFTLEYPFQEMDESCCTFNGIEYYFSSRYASTCECVYTLESTLMYYWVCTWNSSSSPFYCILDVQHLRYLHSTISLVTFSFYLLSYFLKHFLGVGVSGELSDRFYHGGNLRHTCEAVFFFKNYVWF